MTKRGPIIIGDHKFVQTDQEDDRANYKCACGYTITTTGMSIDDLAGHIKNLPECKAKP